MAKRNQSELPQVPASIGFKFLRELSSKGQQLLKTRISADDFATWELLVQNYLIRVFGVNSQNIPGVLNRYYSGPAHLSESDEEKLRVGYLQTQLKKIEGLTELLNTEAQLSEGKPVQSAPTEYGHKVFLVHGHDMATLHETARFLEKLNQNVIILREQPNQGKTIIEKFIEYSEVGFAVVLLTHDDRGGTFSTPFEKQMARARQNVIFELGYFIGKLGRNRVCALYSQDVEIPSDYSGVLFIELDNKGAWRMALAREMKEAGFQIDMNLAV